MRVAVAVPLSEIACGLFVAELAMLSVPVRVPGEVGANLTLTTQFDAGFTAAPHPLVSV